MNRLKALQNPFLLVAEGFIAGAVLFLSVTPGVGHDLIRHASKVAHAAPQR